MIKDVEFSENIENFRAPGFPSYDEIIKYEARGEGKKNALEYEKAYIALIEQVKDKPREEQVKFTIDYARSVKSRISSERGRKKAEAENKFAKEHPEEYKAMLERSHQKAILLGTNLRELGFKLRKKLADDYGIEEPDCEKINNN